MASECRIAPLRTDPRNKAAIVFIHGGGGDIVETWGDFPAFLGAARQLSGWDIHAAGYRSRLVTIPRWTANPGMTALAGWFGDAARSAPLDRYDCLAIVAHSLGGLVAQRALLDNPGLAERVGYLFMFGTSSNGFALWLVDLLVNQIREIRPGGEFITRLRREWKERFIDRPPPFKYWSIAGTEDDFVQTATTHEPFPEEYRRFVPGDHGSIARPESAESQSVRIVANALAGKNWEGPLNSALIAVEARQFQRAIAQLEQTRDLDQLGRVTLALAYEGVGRTEDALKVLAPATPGETDAMGTLAGRLKRRWLRNRSAGDAESALALYRRALDAAIAAEDWDQAFYHGINIAFMELAKNGNRKKAADEARAVLGYCEKARPGRWRCATEGEAFLLLGATERALERYERAFTCRPAPSPREAESMYFQSKHVATLTQNELAAELLEKLFTRGGEHGA